MTINVQISCDYCGRLLSHDKEKLLRSNCHLRNYTEWLVRPPESWEERAGPDDHICNLCLECDGNGI